MTTKLHTMEYEIPSNYMRYVIGEHRCNLYDLYSKYPTTKFKKLWNGRCGFYIEASSLSKLDEVRRDLDILMIYAEKQWAITSKQNQTYKERAARLRLYEAAERIKRNFDSDSEKPIKEMEINAENVNESTANSDTTGFSSNMSRNRFAALLNENQTSP